MVSYLGEIVKGIAIICFFEALLQYGMHLVCLLVTSALLVAYISKLQIESEIYSYCAAQALLCIVCGAIACAMLLSGVELLLEMSGSKTLPPLEQLRRAENLFANVST